MRTLEYLQHELLFEILYSLILNKLYMERRDGRNVRVGCK